MNTYKSSVQFYSGIELLFETIEERLPEASEALSKSGLIIRMKFTDPTAEIVINGRTQRPQVMFGSNSIRPDLNIEMGTDTWHKLLMGELQISKAISGKKVKVRGALMKALVLKDFFDSSQRLYPQVIEKLGIGN